MLIIRKIRKQFELEKRDDDELMYDDEVEVDAGVPLRDRFTNYQTMKSFKTSDWNILENLPDPYE